MTDEEFDKAYANWEKMSASEKRVRVEALNTALLADIQKVHPQGMKENGVFSKETSEKAARQISPDLNKHDLKAKFEALGAIYNVSPALLAAIGSRESFLGRILNDGWGDYIKRKGESPPFGFGIMQVDRINGEVPQHVLDTLNTALRRKTKLDPFKIEWLRWGVVVLVKKQKNVENKKPSLSPAFKLATAVSWYNGGSGRAFPENDKTTTGGDYANDVLVRAQWFAKNWGTIR